MVYAQKIVSGYRYSLQGNDMMRKREKWQGRDKEHQRAYARRNYLLCAEWAPFTILSAGLQAWNVKQAPQWNVLLVVRMMTTFITEALYEWCVVLLRRHSGKVWVPGLHARLDRVLSTPPLFRLHPGLGAAATGCRPVIGKRCGILLQSLHRSIRRGVQVSLPVVRASPGVSQLTIPLSKV